MSQVNWLKSAEFSCKCDAERKSASGGCDAGSPDMEIYEGMGVFCLMERESTLRRRGGVSMSSLRGIKCTVSECAKLTRLRFFSFRKVAVPSSSTAMIPSTSSIASTSIALFCLSRGGKYFKFQNIINDLSNGS